MLHTQHYIIIIVPLILRVIGVDGRGGWGGGEENVLKLICIHV